jgi:hypothetical protein
MVFSGSLTCDSAARRLRGANPGAALAVSEAMIASIKA